MPHLFFDMSKDWAVVLLVERGKTNTRRDGLASVDVQLAVEWWAREVDEAGARASFDRWSARGHAAYLTRDGVVVEQSAHVPRSYGNQEVH